MVLLDPQVPVFKALLVLSEIPDLLVPQAYRVLAVLLAIVETQVLRVLQLPFCLVLCGTT